MPLMTRFETYDDTWRRSGPGPPRMLIAQEIKEFPFFLWFNGLAYV